MLITEFLEYIQYEKGYSEHTRIAYKRDLEQFAEFLKNQYDIEDLTTVEQTYIRSWIVAMMQQGKSASTIHRKTVCLKSFYKFLDINAAEREVKNNPTKHLITPKIRKFIPSFVKVDEMTALFDSFEAVDFQTQRDKTILMLLYATGIRRSELIALRISDIDFGSQYIKVSGKGQKQRIIPIQEKVIECLQIYLDLKTKTFEQNIPQVFVTSKGEALYPKAVYNIVNKHLSPATTAEQKSPHTLRHTFATHLLHNGAALDTIKVLLGHSSLAATQHYAHTTLNTLREAYNLAHPSANS